MSGNRFPDIEAGVVDARNVRMIAVQLVKACSAAPRFPFGLDLDGAKRLLAFHDIDVDAEPDLDLDLWVEEANIPSPRRDEFRATVLQIGGQSELSDMRAIACSLVVAADSYAGFPFTDADSARKLLRRMSIHVDQEGDLDLDKRADAKCPAAPTI